MKSGKLTLCSLPVSLILVIAFSLPLGAADFEVTATAAESDYTINGQGGSPTLTLIRGRTYTFDIDTCSCHPFEILGAPPDSITNNTIFSGTLTFAVPETAATYTYHCPLHGFGGTINTIDDPEPPGFPRMRLELVVEKQIQSPTCITHAGDGSGRLFVAEQRGKIHIVNDGILQPSPFLDIEPKLVPERPGFDERGLLSFAFHPQYGQAGQPGTGKFYVFYNAPSPGAPGTPEEPVDSRSTIAEYTVSAASPDQADAASERILLAFDKPQFNHNGGQLAFGPDGLLYVSVGDGGSANDNNAGHTGGSASSPRPTNALGNAQDRSHLLGKILRLDPFGTNGPGGPGSPGGQYGIPADNPFVGVAGVREEIWAWGLRNPWRFSFDRVTGRLFCADVGQGEIEEVNIIEKGGNYGWRNFEGTFVPDFSIDAPPLSVPALGPIAQYAHPGVVKGEPELPQFGISITGGFLYRGTAIPEAQGHYIFGDYTQDFATPKGILLGLQELEPGTWSLSQLEIDGGNPIDRYIQTFGEDETGEIYLGCKQTLPVSGLDNGLPAGSLLKLAPSEPAPTLTRRQEWERQYYFIGQSVDPSGDDDADGLANLLEYAWALHPKQPSPPESGFRLASASDETFTVVFRRDPRTVDLTCRLEASADLREWTPVVTSLAGAAPTGSALVSDTEIAGQPPLREVTASVPVTDSRYLRLAVFRP